MHGSVGIDSHAGQGFRLWLRIHAGRTSDSHSSDATPGNRHRLAPTHPPLILIATADATLRQQLETLLTEQGVPYESVGDGQQVIARITSDTAPRPSLLLLDCQLPVLDGDTATRHIRLWEQNQDQPRLPIVALAADLHDEDRPRKDAAGIDDVLPLPVQPPDLAAVLGKWR
jgi:CheY-like chemotaxis protein